MILVMNGQMCEVKGGDWDESKHPRDETGKFSEGGVSNVFDDTGDVKTHYVKLDPTKENMGRLQELLKEGSDFKLERAYTHPTDPVQSLVLQFRSHALYQDLDLDINSMSSPLRHVGLRLHGLRGGIPIEKIEEIYKIPLTRERGRRLTEEGDEE